ncbi:type II toxin-antitoxin system VapC family toxin [Arthrobacter sp. UYEF20]|uniref:type II toxin-antitoxin system VapC family toxin n=1 Tax=Arthrobacter sp. UYEF20 TaxID=1756363 RepID=UPI0033951DED
MILVDTSIWIGHLRASEPGLITLLDDDEVGCHPYVIEELALGSIKQREVVLDLLASLGQFPVLSHAEVMTLVSGRRLWGRGLSAVDGHLLGAVALVGGARLWTRDKRLIGACRDVGVGYLDEP